MSVSFDNSNSILSKDFNPAQSKATSIDLKNYEEITRRILPNELKDIETKISSIHQTILHQGMATLVLST